MGSVNHIPPLQIEPQQQNPLDQYSKLASIQALSAERQQRQALMPGALQQQQQQLEAGLQDNKIKQLQVAQAQQDAKDQQTMRQQAPNFLQKDSAGNVTGYDTNGYFNSLLGNGVSPMKVAAARNAQAEMTKNLAQAGDAQIKLADAKNDNAYQILEGIRSLAKLPNTGPNTLEGAYHDALPKLQQLGIDTSKFPQSFAQVGDQGLQQFEAQLGLHKQIVNDAKTQAETNKANAEAGGAPTSPLGDKIPQLNEALAARYAVLNPGQKLPPAFALQPNATKADFDRVDKILDATERAQGTKAQQDTANAMREQTLALSQGKNDITPVIGTDSSGKTVLASISDAKDLGLTGIMKAGEQEVSKAQAARHWIPLATAQGNTPESMGILPLIDKLDKEGKLGVVASRWNDFMAGKVGAGDPDIAALRTKMGLSTTLLMNAHVGNRGGSYMLEHFQDLANAGKMDASTLRTGVKSELDYIKDRAMLPTPKAGTPQATQGSGGWVPPGAVKLQ